MVQGWDDGTEAKRAAAALGLALDKEQPDAFPVWPEHWKALAVFIAMSRSWFVGMSGPVGLRYEALPVVFDAHGVHDRAEVFGLVQVMERATLGLWQSDTRH